MLLLLFAFPFPLSVPVDPVVVLAAPLLLLVVPAAGVVAPAVPVLILFDALDVLVCSHYLSFCSCDRYSRLR